MYLKTNRFPLTFRGIFFFFIAWQIPCLTQDSLVNQMIKSREPKNLHLSHIEIQEKFIDFKRLKDVKYRQTIPFGTALNESFDSVVAYYNYPINLNLPHQLNSLTFHFTAIDWQAPHRIKYSYQLEGLEKKWTKPTTQAKAIYQNLSFGDYTFKVKTVGDNQKWSTPMTYEFSIRRPWWRTWWAYLFYGLSLVTAGIGLFQYSEQRKAEQAEFQRLLAENKLLAFSNKIKNKTAPKEGSFLSLVHQTLEAHLSDENFGIAELCEVLKISRAQLHRKLKKLTGQSTSHYIRSLRLDIAKGLLEKTDLNVSEVAFTVGFSSATYFSKVFKAEFGHAPKNYRMDA